MIRVDNYNNIFLEHDTLIGPIREPVVSVHEWDDEANQKHKVLIAMRDRTYEIHMDIEYNPQVYETARIYLRGRSPLELWRVFEIFRVVIEPYENPYAEAMRHVERYF